MSRISPRRKPASDHPLGPANPHGRAVSPEDAPPPDAVAVGRVADAYGVDGWVKVEPYNAPEQSILRSCRHWWFAGGGGAAVERARVHGSSIVCKLEGIEDRDAALRLRGREILVGRAEFPGAEVDEFYWVDLIGCTVSNRDGRALGTVLGLDHHGAHPILRVNAGHEHDVLLPFVGQWIVSVDIVERVIVTDWPFDA